MRHLDQMDSFIEFVKHYVDYCLTFMGALGQPNKRLFFVFLLVSLMFAYVIYKRRGIADKTGDSFISFLFPKSVWTNPSAWLDVRYFFFHGLIGHFLIFGLGATAYVLGLNASIGFMGGFNIAEMPSYSPMVNLVIACVVLLPIVLLSDFLAFYLHYLQHKIPLLWQFHKVHHAGEVMHSLSNFREHPVDNLTYKLIINLVIGLVSGLIFGGIGYVPSSAHVLGIFALNICFNLSAYHLRHSHIWLKWPGIWSKLYASPAHHHVHHSRHPDHLDKNFAFMFPFWDVLFGTYHMPKDNKDIEFGIVGDSSELNSCLNLYIIPFRDAYRLIKKDLKKDVGTTVEMEVSSPLNQPNIRTAKLVPDVKT